jgi:hypothetical protein
MPEQSAKPPRAPAFDDKAFAGRLHERVLTATGKPYVVFDPENDEGERIGFPRFIQWVRNLRDAVVANAVYLDDVKGDLDDHKAIDGARHANLAGRVAALEEAQQHDPFPGSG